MDFHDYLEECMYYMLKLFGVIIVLLEIGLSLLIDLRRIIHSMDDT
ncbi:unnamed protein product [marine sediment metagenome]|uniref:Uncharacterized protein n=1 Tax=marine sediment metagenome TaxID=412755 RepID=X1AUT2_9ZZZZ